MVRIKAWADLTGLRLCPFESATIMMLSAAYADMLNEANRPKLSLVLCCQNDTIKTRTSCYRFKNALRPIVKEVKNMADLLMIGLGVDIDDYAMGARIK